MMLSKKSLQTLIVENTKTRTRLVRLRAETRDLLSRLGNRTPAKSGYAQPNMIG